MRDVRRICGGRGLCGGPGKRADGCFLDDLRVFGINANQWTTAAQDEGEWCGTAEREAEHFMAKWIVAEEAKAGLGHAVVCPNVGDGKDEEEDSPKQAGSCWFARTC